MMGGGWEERGEGQSCPVSSLNLEKVIFMALGVGFGHVRCMEDPIDNLYFKIYSKK